MIGQISWAHYLVATAIVIVCLLLVIIVLLQKGRGGGLTAAFGGSSGSAFGSKTGDVFTWITVAFAALYLILNVSGNYLFRQEVAESQPPQITATPVSSTDPTAQPAAGTVTAPPGVKIEPVEFEEVLQNVVPQSPDQQPSGDTEAAPSVPPPTERPVQPEPQPEAKPVEEGAEEPSDPAETP